MTNVAVAMQVYDLTRSSFYVGLVGVFALGPLVLLGLYGGAIADAMDRRTLALIASAGLWAVSVALAAQAFAHSTSVWVLYALHRRAVRLLRRQQPGAQRDIPRLLDKELIPAAAALNMASFNLGFTFGPMLGALAIKWQGFGAAYAIDVVTFSAAYYALVRMPRMPPLADSPRAGLRSVVDGLGFLEALAEPADDVRARPLRDGAGPAALAVPGAGVQGLRRRRRRPWGCCSPRRPPAPSSRSCSPAGSAGSGCRAWRSSSRWSCTAPWSARSA